MGKLEKREKGGHTLSWEMYSLDKSYCSNCHISPRVVVIFCLIFIGDSGAKGFQSFLLQLILPDMFHYVYSSLI